MRFTGFIGPSYTLQSLNVDCQRCINLYPEVDELGTGNEGEVASLVSTPGLRLLVTLPQSPVRGVFCDSMGQLWAVGGNILYKISSAWVATVAGTLLTFQGPVDFSDNGTQAVLVDGTYGYYWNLSAPISFAQIIDPSFYSANSVTFMDGYLLFNRPGTNEFYFSGLNQVVPFNGLDIAAAEANPENMVGLIALQENLYLFSKTHLEVWYNSGAASLPFARIQGAVIEVGCASAATIAFIQTAVFWLAKDKNGQGVIYRIQGLQPERISTFAIENELKGLDLSGARSWTYQQAGHFFYCLNVPATNTTWVYDTTIGLWHERAYLSSAGLLERHRADCHAFAFMTHVVGDYSNGNIYTLDQDVFSDNGNPIRRERTAPHLSKDLNRIFHSRFWLDMETGLGLDGLGQGTDPQVMLQWSNDYAHTWSNEHWISAGKIGKRRFRVNWRRLGESRDRVYRIQITDPIKVTLLGAELEMTLGSS